MCFWLKISSFFSIALYNIKPVLLKFQNSSRFSLHWTLENYFCSPRSLGETIFTKRRSPLIGRHFSKDSTLHGLHPSYIPFLEITMSAHDRICPKILRKLGLRDSCKQHCSRSSYNHNGNRLSQSIKSDSKSLRLIIPAVS